MDPNPSTQDTDEVLARRVEELQALRQAEHDTVFSGDEREVTGEISTVGQHPADVADITFQREMQASTERLLDAEVEQVKAAMLARERGTYGTCTDCGRPISAERLQARPEATLCIDCQARSDAGRP